MRDGKKRSGQKSALSEEEQRRREFEERARRGMRTQGKLMAWSREIQDRTRLRWSDIQAQNSTILAQLQRTEQAVMALQDEIRRLQIIKTQPSVKRGDDQLRDALRAA